MLPLRDVGYSAEHSFLTQYGHEPRLGTMWEITYHALNDKPVH